MNRFMKKLGIMICIFCILWKTPQIARAYTYGTEEMNKTASISVEYGLIPELKFNRYMTLHVNVKSHATEELTGNLQVIMKKNGGGSQMYQQEIAVPALGTARADFYIPLISNTPNMYIQMVDEDGEVHAKFDVKFPVQSFQTEIFTGVLGSRERVAEFLDGLTVDTYSDAVFQTFPLNGEAMPENVLGLDMLDIILANTEDYNRLSEKQKKAVELWVAEGGILIMDEAGSFSMYNEDNFEVSEIEKGLKIRLLFRAESLVDFCESSGNSVYATTLFSEMIPDEKINMLEGEAYGSNEEYWKAYSLVSSIPAGEVPNLFKYAILIIGYIILAGPVLFYILRRKNLQRFSRVGVGGITLLFAVLIFIAGSKTRFQRPFINYGTIMEMNPETITERVYFGLRSPNNNPYQTRIDAKYEVLPLYSELNSYSANSPFFMTHNTYFNANDLTARPQERYEMTLDKKETETSILVEDEVAFTANYFYGIYSHENEENTGFVSNIKLYDDKISGTVVNNTGHDMSMVVLIMDRQLVILGEIEDGGIRTLSGQKIYDFTPNTYNLSQYLTGLRGDVALKVGQPGYVQATQKMQLLRFYLEEMVSAAGGQDVLLGFPKDETTLCFANDDSVDAFGSTMIVSNIAIDRKQRQTQYQAFPSGAPEVLEGNYSEYDNALYNNRHSVLLYRFDKNLEVYKLRVRKGVTDANFSSENREQFTGEMYFYNTVRGRYEVQDPEKQEYGMLEIAPYLNDRNELQVRYEADTINEGKSMALPEFSVTGRVVDAGN